MKTIAALFAFAFLAATLASCADPLVENANLVKDMKSCDKCGLNATKKHDCGKTGYCGQCLSDCNKEKKMFAETGYEVNATTKVATCKTCKKIMGTTK